MSVTLDVNDTLYVGTQTAGLQKCLDPTNGFWTQFNTGNSGIPSNYVKTVYCDSANTRWIGTFGGGMARMHKNTITTGYPSSNSGLANNNVMKIAPYPNGGMWFFLQNPQSGANLLSLFDNTNWTTYSQPADPLPAATWIPGMASYGTNLYICTGDAGLYHFDQNLNNWNHWDTALPTPFLNGLDVDNNGWVWLASNSGISRYDGQNINTLSPIDTSNSTLPDNTIFKIAVSDSNNIWAGSEGAYQAILYHWDGTDWTTYDPGNTPEIPNALITDIDLDGSGNPWIATENGVVHFNGTTWSQFTTANSVLPNNSVMDIFAEPGGIVWMKSAAAGIHYGIVRFTPSDSTVQTIYNSGLPSSEVRDITRDTDGYRWFATDQGAARFTGTLVSQSGPALQLSTNSINFGTIHADSTAQANVILTNIGDQNVNITDIFLSGPDTASYHILTTFTSPMTPGSQQTISLIFNPVSVGAKTAQLTISSNAPSSPDIVSVTGTAGKPQAQLSVSSVDFGLVHPDSTAIDSLLITNNGTFDLQISNLVSGGTNGDAFYLFAANNTAIPPGLSKKIYIEFTPATAGTKTAWGIITSNAASSPDTVALAGRAGVPALSPDVETLDFGSVGVGLNSSRQVTITNSGTAEGVLYSWTFIGPDADLFTLASEQGQDTIQPGESKNYGFFFTPTSEGQKIASVVGVHSAPSSPDTLELRGEGVPRSQTPELQLGTDVLDFGAVDVGVSRTATISLSNIGLARLDISSIRLVSQTAGIFQVTPTTAQSLEPDSSSVLTVQFTPNIATAFTGFIVVTSNSGSSPDSIQLAGSGRLTAQPAIQITPGSLAFGTVRTGHALTLSTWIHSTGTAPLLIQNITLNQGVAHVYEIMSTTPGQINPGDSAIVTVSFTPTSDSTYNATCLISSTASASPNSVITITGKGEVLTFNLTVPPPTAGAGNYNMNFTMNPPIPGITVWVHYNQAGSAQWDSIRCTAQRTTQGDEYQAVLPDSILKLRGLTYFMEVLDSTGATIYQNGSPTAPAAFLPVEITKETSPVVPEEKVYTMISVPCNLENNQILDVLRDDLGLYSAKSWRLFFWNRTTKAYEEFGRIADRNLTFTPGAAYWLITQRTQAFSIENGSSTEALTPFDITLLPGWNQIGNPFSFAVAWSRVENHSLVSAPVGRIRNEYTYNNAYLLPWHGYFVYNSSPAAVTIRIPPVEAPGAPAAKVMESGFEMQLALEGQKSGWLDTQNFVGMTPDSKDAFDLTDYLEAPPIGEGLHLAIVQDNLSYAGNFKPFNENGAFWDLSLASSGEKEAARFSLTGLKSLPEGFGVWLLDRNRECLIPLDNAATILEIPEVGQNRSLRLIVGQKSFADASSEGIPLVPFKMALFQNYPNPFNPETQITYTLAEKSRIHLAVYNLLGQLVVTLKDNLENTGEHQSVWDGRDAHGLAMPSGVYLYKLETGKSIQTRKMILVR